MTQPDAARVERGPITEVKRFALGMADLLERQGFTIAAAELRRLYAERTAADGVVNDLAAKVRGLQTKNDALLEALELLVSYTESCEGLLNASPAGQVLKARAAIKAAEENT